jgi:hypothetical protein
LGGSIQVLEAYELPKPPVRITIGRDRQGGGIRIEGEGFSGTAQHIMIDRSEDSLRLYGLDAAPATLQWQPSNEGNTRSLSGKKILIRLRTGAMVVEEDVDPKRGGKPK